jgi:hypothetical protein
VNRQTNNNNSNNAPAHSAASSVVNTAKPAAFAVPLPLPPKEPIKNPILGSLYDEQEVDMIDHSSDAYHKKQQGGAGQSIVDENGEIPDIDTE